MEAGGEEMGLKRIMIFLIKGYQKVLSPFTGRICRFHPTCSQYSIESYEKHGFVKGSWLTIKRIARCHPFHPGGMDPVPNKNPNKKENPH